MIQDYLKAKKMGERAYRRALFRGQYPYLPSLEEMVSGIDRYPEISLGLADIPLDMIVGTRTKGRQNAFASNFMPLMEEKSEFALKWSRLFDSQVEEGIREPIKVYEFMNRFYVEEGNKRVSVMQYLGAVTIPANVIRIRPPRNDTEQSRIYYEFLDFYKVTKLFEITFSAPGRYEKLARILEQNLRDPWPEGLLKNLHAGFVAFRSIFKAKGGTKMSLTVGDALLIYLSVYSLDSLFRESESEITRRMMRMWREFATASRPNVIALIERREDAETEEKPDAITLMAKIVDKSVYSPANPLRVAFINERDSDSSGWVYGHELGRNHLKDVFGSLVETMQFDHCGTEEEIRDAFDKVLENKCRLVFTTSGLMTPYALRFALENPGIKVLNCSFNQTPHAVRFYYGKLFEAKYLLGALAASLSDDHRIGYYASKNDPAAISNVNAFALGAQVTDPYCRIQLRWTENSIPKEIFQTVEAKRIHVFSDTDMISPQNKDRRYGVYLQDDTGAFKRLAAPLWNWGAFYEIIVRRVLEGTYDSIPSEQKDRSVNYWLGISSGIIEIILSDDLPRPSRKLMKMLERGIAEERIRPFDGVLYDRDGKEHGTEESALGAPEIMSMDWLAENIDEIC